MNKSMSLKSTVLGASLLCFAVVLAVSCVVRAKGYDKHSRDKQQLEQKLSQEGRKDRAGNKISPFGEEGRISDSGHGNGDLRNSPTNSGSNLILNQTIKSADCQPFILYDKPQKTGSTTITVALGDYLRSFGEKDFECIFKSCLAKANEIIEGTAPPVHLLGHIILPVYSYYRLKAKGYYTLTSIREPSERWRSAYYYNKGIKTGHYGIPQNSTYEYFMAEYPDCALLQYYDGMDKHCGDREGIKEEVSERIKKIVEKFDEIIDLTAEPMGPMYRKLKTFLKFRNVKGGKVSTVHQRPEKDRMVHERKLYEALRSKMEKGATGRPFCFQ